MKTTWKSAAPPLVIVAGAVLGVLAVVLVEMGNPPNMGLCVACFERDIAGAVGLHRTAAVQYLRPELAGLVLGAVLAAALGREFRGRTAPAPAVSFVVGALVMIGALAFLGCPVRMTLRLAAGDLNALLGLAGFAAGIAAGTLLLKRGYSLGRAAPAPVAPALVLPVLAVGLLALVVVRPSFIFFSVRGPGSMAAPVWAAAGAGAVVGVLAQRSRLCFAGGVRDLLLIRSPHLLVGLAAALAAGCAMKLSLGQFRLGFAGQPIAHSEHLWNILGMALVGLGSVLLGGCPLRQVVLASQGDGSAFAAVLGMVGGAALGHNFHLAGGPGGVPTAGRIAVVAGLALCVLLGWVLREK